MSRLALLATILAAAPAAAQVTADAPGPRARAIVDLATVEGAKRLGAAWRYHDARIVEVDHRDPGPDLRASGAPNRTNDIEPKAGGLEVDERDWTPVAPPELLARRTHGRLAFGWYRVNLTIPERVDDFELTGATAVFEIVVDDYAEVWVDGKLTPVLGQTGGGFIRGFNAPNRVVIGRDLRPGQRIQLAVFAINGPLSAPPVNFVWIRSATVDFYPKGALGNPVARPAMVVRKDAGLDAVVSSDATIEKLAGGFGFVEGPVWVDDAGGYLLFSDPNNNLIYRYTRDGEISIFRTKSGYTGPNLALYHQPGSNGLALDADGRVTIDQHGNRRVIRVERTGAITVLADRYQGKRLNSPNDLVYRSDGSLYFTDPPFGLPKAFDDPAKELPHSGVYRWHDGELTLLTDELRGPNGIAFSPDERYLYVDNWDPARKVIMRYPVQPDGRLAKGTVFFDLTTTVPGEDAWDGIKVDRAGHVFAAGPEGIYVLDPTGKHLGTIVPPEHVANFAWGDDDRRTLYVTASSGLYRIRLLIPGADAFRSLAASR